MIVFSDIDGTLLNDRHEMLPSTETAIRMLDQQGIPFVLCSSRSAACISPIIQKYHLNCPEIAFGGGLILDKDRNILYSKSYSVSTAARVIHFFETCGYDCCWNLYAGERWIVKDATDPRIVDEAQIVQLNPEVGDISLLSEDEPVHKLLIICEHGASMELARLSQEAFPELNILTSADFHVEIMPKGVSKAAAVLKVCQMWNHPVENTIAFGDNYNDMEMLDTVGIPYLMSNAPEELKRRSYHLTTDNNHDGIASALRDLKLITD